MSDSINLDASIDNSIWYWVAVILILLMVVVIIFYSLNKLFEMRKNSSLTRHNNDRKKIRSKKRK